MPDRDDPFPPIRYEELNYGSYLKIPDLLSLQRPLSNPVHPDELFFIIIHQSFELWFRLSLHETNRLVEHLRAGAVSRALKVVKRMNAIVLAMSDQIQLLSTLTPAEFAGFRERLGTGSGFQSLQYRELEFAWGIQDQRFLKFFQSEPESVARLQARLDHPSVRVEFFRAMDAAGFPVPAPVLAGEVSGVDPELIQTLKTIYENAEDNYHWVLMCEAMLDFDTYFSKFRAVHILMVSRTIGGQKGTGGSSGKAFLESRLPLRFIPELWEVRNAIFEPET